MGDLLKQWFDKRILWVWLGLIILHGLGAFALHQNTFSIVLLGLIGLAVFAVSYHSPVHGLALAFLEIFVGGHGHLIAATVFDFSWSLRIIIFGAVMIAWAISLITKRLRLMPNEARDLPILLLLFTVILGTLKGFNSNDFSAAFDDMNGYLTLLYILPLASINWGQKEKRLLLMTLFSGAIWVAVSSLLLLFAFTHLPGKTLHELYTFVRDTRLAEITLLTDDKVSQLLPGAPWYFRIFEQSQAIVSAFILMFAGYLYFEPKQITSPIKAIMIRMLILTLSFAGFFVGLSRSLILGLLGGAIILTLGLIILRVPRRKLIQIKLLEIVAGILTLITLIFLIILPIPPRPDLTQAAFYQEDSGDTRNLAVSSRWQLLSPMIEEILAKPIWGSGFGETVTFVSDDPRVRAEFPSGEVTTYRFEWGFHDVWLKMGILGLLAFVWYLVNVGFKTIETLFLKPNDWLALGAFCAVLAFYVTNIFTPYLNHPIGLGFLLFVLPFYDWSSKPLASETAVVTSLTRTPSTSTNLAMRQ